MLGPIRVYIRRTETPGRVPPPDEIVEDEIIVNYADNILFYKVNDTVEKIDLTTLPISFTDLLRRGFVMRRG